MFCSNCGSQSNTKSKFCTYCGTEILKQENHKENGLTVRAVKPDNRSDKSLKASLGKGIKYILITMISGVLIYLLSSYLYSYVFESTVDDFSFELLYNDSELHTKEFKVNQLSWNDVELTGDMYHTLASNIENEMKNLTSNDFSILSTQSKYCDKNNWLYFEQGFDGYTDDSEAISYTWGCFNYYNTENGLMVYNTSKLEYETLTELVEDTWIEEGDYRIYFKKIKKNGDIKGIVKVKMHLIDEDGEEQTWSVVSDVVYETRPISNSLQWQQFKEFVNEWE